MALTEMSVFDLRTGFPALKQTIDGRPIVFFDSPGGSQVHSSVIDAIQRYFITSNSNAHGAFSLSIRTDEMTYTSSRFSLEFGIWLPNTFWGGKLWVE